MHYGILSEAYTFNLSPQAFASMQGFPQELIHKTIDHLAEALIRDDLRTCSLVAKHWTSEAQKKQFESVYSLSLDTSKKLLALITESPHIGTYIKSLEFRVDSFDVGTGDAALAVLPEIIKSLPHLEALDLSVVARCGPPRDSESLHTYVLSQRSMGSYLFPPVLMSCLQRDIREYTQYLSILPLRPESNNEARPPELAIYGY